MLEQVMRDACASIGIVPPGRTKVGQWVRTNTLERNGKGDASVLIFDDAQGGIAWNWQTQIKQPFSIRQPGVASAAAPRRDPERERRQQEEQRVIESVCADIVRTCGQAQHPYLERKGFPDEIGLVHEAPWRCFPSSNLGDALMKAMPEGYGPFLIVPGRIGKKITTVQFITPEGVKKNILRGQMGGASHRIATGRLTVVCEGIATALSVRAALRLLNASATVLSAFSASNVAKVAEGFNGSFIAADHDKPVEALGGLGTGQYYAVKSGCRWAMPPCMGDFNDMYQSDGIRAVALHLREAVMG